MTTTDLRRPSVLKDPPSHPTTMPEDVLESVLHAIDCGIVVHGPGAEILAVNRKACELLGLSESQIRGRTSFDARWNVVDELGNPLPPELHPAVLAEARGVPARNVVMGVFHPQREHRVWLLVSAVPELDANDDVYRVVVTFVDISKRREVESESQRDKTLMEEVFRTMPAGIAVIDATGAVLRINQAAEKLLSMRASSTSSPDSPRSLPGEFVNVDGTVLNESERPIRRVLDSQEGFNAARYMWIGPSGRRRIFSINGARLRSPVSGDHQAVLTFHDITQQEATRQATRHSKHRLDAALRAADLSRIDIHVKSNALSADAAWLVRHGLPPSWAETESDQWLRCADPSDLEAVRESWQNHLRGATPIFNASMWFKVPTGQRVRLQLTGQADQRDAHGQVSRLSGVLRDITKEHKAAQTAARLDAQVAELARLEGTTAIAGGVTHTFSNLLAGVLAAVTESEAQVQPGTPLAEALALIRDATEQANLLTTQLRGVSGHGRFRLQVTDLQQQASQMKDLLNTALAGRGQVVVRQLNPAPQVEVDTDQLRQVAVNLVLNAADADPRPCPRVVVQTRALTITTDTELEGLATPGQPAPGEYAALDVIDAGSGMTEDVQARMFEPFFSTEGRGLGLGLSAVLGIARGHNGFVTVRTSPGHGTTVTLALRAYAGAAHPTRPPSPPVFEPPPATAQTRVLVVDDEPVIRRLVTRVLQRSGHKVDAVSDGQLAIDTLLERRSAFDLMLLDLTMPGMSGEEVLSLAQDRWPDLPIIVMSGYTEGQVIGRLVGSGKVGFIGKPFTADQLRSRVRRALVDGLLTAP